MPVNNSTANRGYQLPHPSNLVSDDINRLIAAFNAIDADVATAILAIAGKAAATHGHVINDVAGLQSALDGKMVAGTAGVLTAIAGAAFGSIGSYVWANYSNQVPNVYPYVYQYLQFGDTTSGGRLALFDSSGANVSTVFAGTWRYLGGTSFGDGYGLFLRIA